ncbi:MAG: peptidylprolyl isomerase [Colwellia sp.]
MLNRFLKTTLALVFTSSILATTAQATIVEFDTNHGQFQVNLFDTTTPKTVENFLNYVDSNHYTDTVIHRVVSDFVVQGGGFAFEGDWPLKGKEANESVVNEPVYANVAGTIAMAKVGGDPDSATNQWFFNLADNSANLDNQNGGFTAFGQVIGDGMNIINNIAALKTCQDIPMTDYSAEDCTAGTTPGVENFVVVYSVTVIDSSTVTDANLTPKKSTKNDTDTPADDSSGGAFIWLSLLVAFVSARKVIKK